jgi:hypothetical protein
LVGGDYCSIVLGEVRLAESGMASEGVVTVVVLGAGFSLFSLGLAGILGSPIDLRTGVAESALSVVDTVFVRGLSNALAVSTRVVVADAISSIDTGTTRVALALGGDIVCAAGVFS